ncbi:ABC transporter permease [Vibrio gangliei]|uniref:ABC transporter permease n=1 Tax=Vibrio gangliei TaxID=2077090 RepID=UPI001B804075|nr:thiamine ABC transporter permease [Vibrio gangliei]
MSNRLNSTLLNRRILNKSQSSKVSLRLGYAFVVLLCIFPIIPGLIGMLSPAFGIIPPLGLFEFSLTGFEKVADWPAVMHSICLSMFSAITSTFLATIMAFSILQAYWNRPAWHKVEKLLSPLLALPHVAFAVGFLFLFSDTGWFARALNSVFSAFSTFNTQGWLNVQDNLGLGLTLALAIKETPFLVLMSLPILNNLRIQQTLAVSQSLGYSAAQTWWKVILPQWLRHMRFPFFAIMAYSSSVVDVSLIIGPTHPPTFAVLVWQWFNEPDLSLLPRAAAGALCLFLLCSALIGLVYFIERLLLHYARGWLTSGKKNADSVYGKSSSSIFSPLSINSAIQSTMTSAVAPVLMAVSLLCLPALLVWTFAQRWQFPQLLPSDWSLRFWISEWPYIQQAIQTSLCLAVASTIIALIFAIIAQEYRQHFRLRLPMYVIALPMLIPQLSLLFGLQVTTLWINQEYYWLWVIWSHLFFAFPYIYLSLDGPWQSYPTRLSQTAVSLSASPFKAFVMIKLRTLASALAFAFSMGMSVSLAQYLPTLMLGSGRIVTLTTEAVALSSGHDRRIIALYALWQALVPFIFFSLALVANRFLTQPNAMQKPAKYQNRDEDLKRNRNRDPSKHPVPFKHSVPTQNRQA